MRLLLLLTSCALLLAVFLKGAVAPPVTANKKEDSNHTESEQKGADWDVGLEYNRYLQEVVQALESDPQFREKLEKAEVADIRTGKIASELEFVNHNVRSKLDELKRQELERLRHLAIMKAELERQKEAVELDEDGENNEVNQVHGGDPHHVDHHNPYSFEIEDLRKLIVKTTKDLEDADKKRREEFKEYEMQKEFERQQQMNLLDEEHKKEYEKKVHDEEAKHKDHPNLHHPGSKQQLEEVWEEQDHMNPEDFNPKTFFHLHDLDGNGYWDADEVKALFQKELDKMYDPNAPEDDMRERREEMERMREHVFNETDTNRDQLISYQEFLDQTKKQEFEQDPGWEGLDNQQVYTNEEYKAFEQHRQQEIDQMMQQGLLPPRPDLHLPHGMQVPPEYIQQQHQMNMNYNQQHHQYPGGAFYPGIYPPPYHQPLPPMYPHVAYNPPNPLPMPPQVYHPNPQGFQASPLPPHGQPQYHPQGGAPMHPNQQYQYHPGNPPQHPNAIPQQQGYHPNAVPQQQMHHPNAMPQQQMHHPNAMHQQQMHHPNAVPQQQIHHPNAMPQQQIHHPNAVPQQHHPNAVPQQQFQHPNAVPQQQQAYNPNAIPQQGYHQPNQAQQQQHVNNPPPPNQVHPDPQASQPEQVQGHHPPQEHHGSLQASSSNAAPPQHAQQPQQHDSNQAKAADHH